MYCRTFLYLAYHKFIMVARSGVARARLPLYLAESLFSFFLFLATLTDVGNRHPRNFPIRRWLSLQQNLCYTDFFKVPLKMNGGHKTQNLHFLWRSDKNDGNSCVSSDTLFCFIRTRRATRTTASKRGL